MILVEQEHVAVWKRTQKIAAKIFHFKLLVALAAEVVDHHEPAAVDVLAKIQNFFIGQIHFAGLRNVAEGILEDLRATEFDDLIGNALYVDARRFLHDLKNVLFRGWIIMHPATAAESAGAVVPTRKNELRRWRIVLTERRRKPSAKTITLRVGDRDSHCDQQEYQAEF